MTQTSNPICDSYGILIEDQILSGINLAVSARVADDTHPTLLGAMALAAEALVDGAESVSVVSCRWGQGALRLSPVAGDVLATLRAHSDLSDHA
jgi:hypothetical protein